MSAVARTACLSVVGSSETGLPFASRKELCIAQHVRSVELCETWRVGMPSVRQFTTQQPSILRRTTAASTALPFTATAPTSSTAATTTTTAIATAITTTIMAITTTTTVEGSSQERRRSQLARHLRRQYHQGHPMRA